MKKISALILLVLALDAGAQTTVLFPLAQMTGTTNDTTITIKPVNNPINWRSQVYWLPIAGIQLRTTNGAATTNLIPNDYNVTIAGVPASWKISVSDTNVTLNAAEIGNLTVYSANGPLPGVSKIIAGTGATVSPASGMGVVTVGLQGTGSGIGLNDATNVVAGASGVIQSTSATTFKFSSQGTNDIEAIGDARYDSLTTALAREANFETFTNSLGDAAFKGTNAFDLAGSASAAVQTNDSRSLNLTGTASQMHGRFFGDKVDDGNPFVIGDNAGVGFYNSGGQSMFMFGANGSYGSINNGPHWWQLNVSGDRPLRYFDFFDQVGGGSSKGNVGALQTTFTPFIGGSAESLTALTSHGAEMRSGMPHPWIGVTTDDPTQTATPASPTNVMIGYLQLTNMSIYFRTSGIASAFASYNFRPTIWGDCGWEQTNRQANGALQEISALFPGGVSNIVYIVHTNGSALMMHIYHTTDIPIQSVGDTAYRTDVSGTNPNSYPSQASSSAVTYTYPEITPISAPLDVLWYYTNGIDGIFDADGNQALQQGYEHERLASIADAILYPTTTSSGRVYWQNVLSGLNPRPVQDFTSPQLFAHQLWFGCFINHGSSEGQFYANVTTPDQLPAIYGTDALLARGMGYLQNYAAYMTNWQSGTFPFISMAAVDGSANMRNYTNWYSIIGEANACSANGWFTNTMSWNTNQTPIATNANFLAAHQDVQRFPYPIWNPDGTNSVWVRAGTNAAFYLLAVNQSAVSSNFNAALTGPRGIPSNTVYFATNIFSQTAFGTGLLTNNFIGAVGASNTVWLQLTPALPQTRVFAFDTSVTVGDTNRADGGHDYGVKANTGGSGTVTSVALSMPSLFSVSGSPITSSGTIGVTANVNLETNNGAIASGALLKSSGGSGATAATAGTDYLAPNGNGSGLTSLTAANLTGTIPFAALPAYVMTNNSQGTFTNNILTNSGPASFAGNTTNFANVYFKGSMNGSAAGLTNYADTNIVVSTNNWNWPGPTNTLDLARGTLQRYQPIDTTPLAITNFAHFPIGQAASVVMWIANTNTAALNVKLPSPCETTNSLGGLTVSVNASNRLQILFQWSPLSTNALFSDQQLIK